MPAHPAASDAWCASRWRKCDLLTPDSRLCELCHGGECLHGCPCDQHPRNHPVVHVCGVCSLRVSPKVSRDHVKPAFHVFTLDLTESSGACSLIQDSSECYVAGGERGMGCKPVQVMTRFCLSRLNQVSQLTAWVAEVGSVLTSLSARPAVLRAASCRVHCLRASSSPCCSWFVASRASRFVAFSSSCALQDTTAITASPRCLRQREQGMSERCEC